MNIYTRGNKIESLLNDTKIYESDQNTLYAKKLKHKTS